MTNAASCDDADTDDSGGNRIMSEYAVGRVASETT